MPISGQLEIRGTIGGISIDGRFNRTAAAGLPPQEVALAAGKAGALTTRTNDTDGTLTLAADHGITDAQVISIFWTDADGIPQFAYRAVVGTVAGTSVPFTGATGTVLPADETAVVACVETELDGDFDGDKVEMFWSKCDQIVGMIFETSVDVVLKAAVRAANEPTIYVADAGQSLGITGNPVDAIRVANGSTTDATFHLAGLYNSDE